MSKAITPKGPQHLSQFLLLRLHKRLMVQKRAASIRVRESSSANAAAKENMSISDRSKNGARTALDVAERGLRFIDMRITAIEKALGRK